MKRLVLVIIFAITPLVRAELKLPALFSDHAVLQSGVEVPVWGWADSGAGVTAVLGDQTASTKSGDDGKWMVKLAPLKPLTEPTTLTVSSGAEKKIFRDILIGELWIGSGQSNMAFGMKRTSDADAAIAAAAHPTIRLFTVKRTTAKEAASDVEGEWVVCTPKTVEGFSAVLYHFGRRIHEETKLPVGLIHSSWGGTPIQAWMPRAALNEEQIEKQHRRASASQPAATRPQSRGHLEPMRLYNGMIAPLAPYAIRGVTWYQGENNTHQGEAGEYAAMMEAMVRSWREKWAQADDWPFLFVQIAPYGKYRGPADSLPIMWEQQTQALGLIPNSGMAVTGDVGNANDIHPKEKRVVGERLAAIALANTYGRKDVAWEPPLVKSITQDKQSTRVHFTTPVKQTVEKLTAFETERDGKFQPVEAIVKDGDVIIKGTPDHIRFQWSPTAGPQLVNDAGLPAVAFSKPIY